MDIRSAGLVDNHAFAAEAGDVATAKFPAASEDDGPPGTTAALTGLNTSALDGSSCAPQVLVPAAAESDHGAGAPEAHADSIGRASSSVEPNPRVPVLPPAGTSSCASSSSGVPATHNDALFAVPLAAEAIFEGAASDSTVIAVPVMNAPGTNYGSRISRGDASGLAQHVMQGGVRGDCEDLPTP